MSTDNDTLAGQLERTPLAGDAIEGERLRKAVKARLLAEAATETRIDRFVVLGQLGAGGMGIVYAAYDPELDRKVAIKLVRTWGTERRAEDQERLVREARALAKLSHPNVVAVYEVGIHGDSVFIAMEFVRGKTLHEHIAPGHTPWREVVRAYIQAGKRSQLPTRPDSCTATSSRTTRWSVTTGACVSSTSVSRAAREPTSVRAHRRPPIAPAASRSRPRAR